MNLKSIAYKLSIKWQDVYSIARDLGIEMDYDWNCRCWRTVSDRVGAQLEEHIRELREI